MDDAPLAGSWTSGMHTWLSQMIPSAADRAWLFAPFEAVVKVFVGAFAFFLARWLLVRALHALMLPLVARAKRENDTSITRLRTLEALAHSAVTYALVFVSVVTVLGQLGINITAILTGAGVAGLALSFGSQRLVRDVLTGFFILLEDQFRVSEVVTLVGGAGLPQMNGTVQEMGLRITRLNDLTGKVVTMANGDIAAVINHSRGPITATVDVGMPAETPLDQIQTLACGMSLPVELFSGAASVQGVTALEATRMVVRLCAPAQPGKAPDAELALRRAAGEALRAAGIEIR